MGNLPRRFLRAALWDSVRPAAGTHVQDEGRGRTQHSNDVHPESRRGDYGFEHCTQVGSFIFLVNDDIDIHDLLVI